MLSLQHAAAIQEMHTTLEKTRSDQLAASIQVFNRAGQW